jgi:hypothetical protein
MQTAAVTQSSIEENAQRTVVDGVLRRSMSGERSQS